MAEEEEEESAEILQPSFPQARIKKIMKVDQEINKINSEALLLISLSTDLFLQFLSEKSSEITLEKKRKIVKLEHIRMAAKRHQPISDFLLDCLPNPTQTVDHPSKAAAKYASASAAVDKPLPLGTRRIDDIFVKSVKEVE